MTALLTINLPPALEEDLVDYLLSLDCVGGFTSYTVKGHGEHDNLSIAEQVSGRRNRLQFEMLIAPENCDRIVADLGAQVGKDIVYWLLPVQQMGRS